MYPANLLSYPAILFNVKRQSCPSKWSVNHEILVLWCKWNFNSPSKKTEGTDDPKTNTMSNNFNVDKEDESLFQKEKEDESNERKQKPEMRRRGNLVYFRLIGQIMSAYHESILKTHSQKDKILKPEN